MDLTIKEMRDNEYHIVKKVGRDGYGPIESLLMANPKHAMVALRKEEIVGGLAF